MRRLLKMLARLSPRRMRGGAAAPGSGGGGGSFDYYIGPSGSDSNDGLTTGTPWAITALNSKRATYTGKTVGLLDGTYDVSADMQAVGDSYYASAFDIDGGTVGASTVIKAVNARLAIIDAKGASGQYGGYTGSGHSQRMVFQHSSARTNQGYLQIDGIKFTGFRTGCIQIGTYGVSSSVAGIVVKNCWFDDGNADQPDDYIDNNYVVELNNCLNALFQNNKGTDCLGHTTNDDHFSGLLVWQCVGTIIEKNSLIDAGNIYGKEIANQGTKIRYNYVKSSGGRGANFVGDWTGAATGGLTDQSEIHHNIAVVDGSGSMIYSTLYESLGSAQGWDTAIKHYNNTIIIENGGVQCPHLITFLQSSADGLFDHYNNIFAGDLSADRKMLCVNAGALGVNGYNLYPSSGTRFRLLNATTGHPDTGAVGDYSNIATYRTAVEANGGPAEASVEVGTVESSQALADLFVLTGTDAAQYVLKAGSDALDAGKSDGTSGGSAVHIGAWDGIVTQIGCDF